MAPVISDVSPLGRSIRRTFFLNQLYVINHELSFFTTELNPISFINEKTLTDDSLTIAKNLIFRIKMRVL